MKLWLKILLKILMNVNNIRAIFNDIDPARSARKKKQILQLIFDKNEAKLNLDGTQLRYILGQGKEK